MFKLFFLSKVAALAILSCVTLTFPIEAVAHGGENHGEQPPPSQAGGTTGEGESSDGVNLDGRQNLVVHLRLTLVIRSS